MKTRIALLLVALIFGPLAVGFVSFAIEATAEYAERRSQ